MRRIRVVSVLLIFVVILAFSSGCSKDKSKPADNYKLPGFADSTINLNVPEGLKNSPDVHAKYVVSEIQAVTDMSGFLGNFVPPDNAVNNNGVYQWSIPYDGNTITFYWQYKDETVKNTWTEQVQFNDDSTRYDFVSAWESKTSETGEVVYNFNWTCADPNNNDNQNNCQDLYYTYSWNTAANGTFTFKKDWQSSQSAIDLYNYEFVSNADGSGSLKEYNQGNLYMDIEWDSQGNGTWTQYSGDTSQSGSWSV